MTQIGLPIGVPYIEPAPIRIPIAEPTVIPVRIPIVTEPTVSPGEWRELPVKPEPLQLPAPTQEPVIPILVPERERVKGY